LLVLGFARLRPGARAARPGAAAPVHITEQLRLEEALFRADDRNWCIVNTGGGGGGGGDGGDGTYLAAPPQIVLGISGKPAKLTDLSRVRRERVPLFRRFTGGGTVVVDGGTTFVSLVCNKAALPAGAAAGPRELMRWSAELYAGALARCGVPVSEHFDESLPVGGGGHHKGGGGGGSDDIAGTAPSHDGRDGKTGGETLPFTLRENDYVLGDKKFAGNAQGLSRDRFVHHTSVLWDFDPDTMTLLSNPEKQPEYRRRRGHGEFLCRLRDVLPRRDALPDALVYELGAMGFEVEEVDVDDPYLREVLARRHHKSSSHVNADNEKLATGPVEDRWADGGGGGGGWGGGGRR
jgi:lipoate-protein ligase A